MSNLGMYQDIVTAAKEAGGVQSLIKIIENQAVSSAAPGIFAKGFGSCLVVVTAAGYVGKRVMDSRKANQAVADEAKAQLAHDVEATGIEDGSHEDETGPGSVR